MKTRFRFALAILFGLGVTFILHYAALLLNAPYNLAFVAGIVVVLAVVVLAPTLFVKLVFSRRKKSNDSQENTSA